MDYLKTVPPRKTIFFVLIFSLSIVAGPAIVLSGFVPNNRAVVAGKTKNENLPSMPISQLAAFDGTEPGRPIYLGFEDLVYDVSAGREYYQKGGSYHFLAGRDATLDLRIAGGSIIKRKYPPVARLAE